LGPPSLTVVGRRGKTTWQDVQDEQRCLPRYTYAYGHTVTRMLRFLAGLQRSTSRGSILSQALHARSISHRAFPGTPARGMISHFQLATRPKVQGTGTYLGQSIHLLEPVVRLDDTPGSEVQDLDGLAPVADRDGRDGLQLRHHGGRIGFVDGHMLPFGHTDADQGTAETQEIQGLRISPIAGGANDDGTGAETARDFLHLFGDGSVVVLRQVDEGLRARVAHDLLLAAGVDADDAMRHAPRRQLHGDVAEPTAGAADDDPLPRFGAGFAQGGECRDASAEHWRRVGRFQVRGDWGHIAAWLCQTRGSGSTVSED